MKLKSVRVTHYKCIRDSGTFEVADMTCLVEKNESGKSAILEALERLNPVVPEHGTFDLDEDFPRLDVEDYRLDVESGCRKPAVVTTATFSLEDEDLNQLKEDLGSSVLNDPCLVLSKGYENKLNVRLAVCEESAVKALVEKAALTPELKQSLSAYTALEELNAALGAITDDTAAQQFAGRISKIVDKGLSTYVYENYIEGGVPKFLYFDEYYRMEGQVNIEQLKERQPTGNLKDSDRPLLALIELSRLKLDQLISPQTTQFLLNRLEGASNHLTRSVMKYWSQSKHLEMRFDIRPAMPGDPPDMQSGTNFWAQVHNLRHKATIRLVTRSRGFVWFFSFLAWFAEQQRRKEPMILLLDEPGLFLHAKAQGDLLEYMEKELKPNHQVIYTTHSPCMIDANRFDRVRIVEDKSMEEDKPLSPDQEGTKVHTDVLEATGDSLFPLHGALGYEIHQTLFIGPNCLIVEGVSDLLYLQAMSGLLEREGKEGLDPRWTITPVGGLEKVPTFVALIGSQKNMNLATLTDMRKKDTQTIENLYKRKLLKKKQVFTYADFTDSTEADVEDMFSVGFYLRLVNAEYQKDLSTPATKVDLTSQNPRVTVRVAEYLQSNPLANDAKFNHYRPARYFAENSFSLRAYLCSEALVRFEKAFRTLNALL